VSVSSNNELVFSGGVEEIVGWNLISNEKDTFSGSGQIHSLFISSANQYCIAGLNDGSTDLIDIKEKSKSNTNLSDEQISTLCFDQTNKKILFGSSANKIQSWDLKSGELLKFDQHTGGITCLSLNAAQNILVSGGKDRQVFLWDYAAGKVNRPFSFNENWVTSVSFNNAKNLLCIASLDNTVKIVDTNSNAVVNQYTHDNVTSVTFSLDANLVYSGGNRSIKVFSLSNNNEQTVATIDGVVNALAIFEDQDLMISGSSNRQIRVGTLKGDLLKTYPCDSSICSVDLSPDKNTIIAGGSEGEVYLIDRELNQVSKILAHAKGKVRTVLMGEREYFLSGGSDGFIKIWNISGKQIVLSLLVAGDDFIIFTKDYYYWSNNPNPFIGFYDTLENKYLVGLDYESYMLQYADKLKIKSVISRIVN
jgi:WD40 repeat protein